MIYACDETVGLIACRIEKKEKKRKEKKRKEKKRKEEKRREKKRKGKERKEDEETMHNSKPKANLKLNTHVCSPRPPLWLDH